MKAVLIIFFALLRHTMGIIGYDCGTSQINVTTISLLDVEHCDLSDQSISENKTFIQVLQLNEYNALMVRQCKVEIQRHVYRCGFLSHSSVVSQGFNSYIMEVDKRACDDAHRYGSFKLTNSHIIHGLRRNSTKRHGLTLVGKVDDDGDCEGTSYTDPFGSWEDVIVLASVTITLGEHQGRVNLNTDKVYLKSGTVCLLSDGFCIDQEGGYTFWNPVEKDTCNFHQFSLLFEGMSSKLSSPETTYTDTVYSVITEDITFALATKGKNTICGYTILKTEHPKLFILDINKEDRFTTFKKTPTENLDIFAYVNSKFVFVERHIKRQMKNLYKDIIIQKCELERQTLKNFLSFATQSPDEFAFDLIGSGHMAVLAGEVVHIVKCIPVEVKVEHGNTCYNELQVSRNNETYFMTPRTHILKRKGTEISCNRLLPVQYKLSDRWYKILPLPTESRQPTIVKPMTKNSWVYENTQNLATSGIYSDKEVQQLRDRIMYPVEVPSVLNDLARGISGHSVNHENGGILNLFDESLIEKLIDNTWTKLWNRFLTFGTVSAGVIAIMTIIHFIKIVVDIVIQGYAIHSIYGWSIHLVGAIWSSISHLLIRLGSDSQRHQQESVSNHQQTQMNEGKQLSSIEHENKTETVSYSQRPSSVIVQETLPNNSLYPLMNTQSVK